MENECKGCLTHDNYNNPQDKLHCAMYIIPHLSKTQQCPCLNCIVKVVCVNRCKAFQDYIDLPKSILYSDLRETAFYDPGRYVNGK